MDPTARTELSLRSLGCTLLALLLVSWTPPAPAAEPPVIEPIRVILPDGPGAPRPRTDLPRHGAVRLAIGVGPDGGLTDVVAVAASDPELARTATQAARTWQYQPATYAGRPCASVAEFALELRAGRLQPAADGDAAAGAGRGPLPVRLQELDRPLQPRAVAPPRYPTELQARRLGGTVMVRFLIDQTGTVRLPYVLECDAAELAPLVLDALRTWRFVPPTRDGSPVVVAARQEFRFTPD